MLIDNSLKVLRESLKDYNILNIYFDHLFSAQEKITYFVFNMENFNGEKLVQLGVELRILQVVLNTPIFTYRKIISFHFHYKICRDFI